MERYEIQTRQKGAWLTWIGFKEGVSKEVVEGHWNGMHHGPAMRLVCFDAAWPGSRIKVVDTKKARR